MTRAITASNSRSTGLRVARDACIARFSLLEPRGDLHDFDYFAARALASDVYAGRLLGPLRATSASIDRA
jgi:hypothetical protein